MLGDRLRAHPSGVRAVHDQRWWTYGELVTAAASIAQRITELGLGRGDVVALPVDRGIEAVVATCATLLAGAIPAVLDPRDRDAAARTIARLRPALVLVAPPDAALPGAHVVELRDGRGELSAATALPFDPVRRDRGISHVIFTSGSTAETKGVIWSELRASFDWSASATLASRRPAGIHASLCTGLGFYELLHALYHGNAVALLHAPFLATLAQIRDLGVDRLRITPTHVEMLLATAELLPEVAAVSVTTAPIAPERLRELRTRLPNARLCRAYGLTESGPATAVWSDRNPRKLHTVGRAVAFRRITVRDPAGNMLPPDQMGEVVIELPMWDACDGYLDAPPELARRFTNGALWTGDRGTIDRQGFLMLGGRQAELLKVGGRSVSAPRIEQALAAMPGVRELVVVGVPDRWLGEAPCAVYVPDAAGDPRVLADQAAARCAIAEDAPRWWLARRVLPRGPTLKLQRGLLAREAARWTGAFPGSIAPAHRRFAAYDLEDGLAIVDGWPWPGDGAIDPCARPIALATRRPVTALAIAAILPADAGIPARLIVGPIACGASDAQLDAFAAELARLATLLPGPAPAAICARSERLGFEPIDGADGWTWWREPTFTAPIGAPIEAAIRAALPRAAADAGVLAAWAQCA
ncbi:MAG TPA: class I adenylate-forming enzyme family protein [Kofleriaceae bacterium]|jgi:acyl-coenzyme A synthetase/AMP-(fatty) acid ligase|nr:class I adenylate-forming enzyme family protein [Kofleriaceae bacterium]